MNAIFNAVTMEEFKRISNVEVTHSAWNILQTVHEGTKAVKINNKRLTHSDTTCLFLDPLKHNWINLGN